MIHGKPFWKQYYPVTKTISQWAHGDIKAETHSKLKLKPQDKLTVSFNNELLWACVNCIWSHTELKPASSLWAHTCELTVSSLHVNWHHMNSTPAHICELSVSWHTLACYEVDIASYECNMNTLLIQYLDLIPFPRVYRVWPVRKVCTTLPPTLLFPLHHAHSVPSVQH